MTSNAAELIKEAEQYLKKMEDRFQSYKRDWERFPQEVYKKAEEAILSGVKPEVTRDHSSSGMHFNVNINLNREAAERYLKSAKVELEKKVGAFHKSIEEFDGMLSQFQQQGLDGKTLQRLVNHFVQWVDYCRELRFAVKDTKSTYKLPEHLLEKKSKWLDIVNRQRLKEDASRFGVPVGEVETYRAYLAAKQKKDAAVTSKQMEEAADLLIKLDNYRDAKELLADAKKRAGEIRKAEEITRKRQEEQERLRRQQEAAKKAEEERIAKQRREEGLKAAEKMRARLNAAAGLIACSPDHCVAVKSDGTVVATGKNSDGECNVSSWRNIVAVACERGSTVGLTAGGRVVYAGTKFHKQNQCTWWRDIKEIAISSGVVYGLCHDGTVMATSETSNGVNSSRMLDVTTWSGIQSIRSSDGTILGIRADGSTVAIERNYHKRCDTASRLDGLKNIEDVSMGYLSCGVMLYSDGRCATTGSPGSSVKSANELNKYSGIVKVHMLDNRPAAILANGSVAVTPASSGYEKVVFADYIKRNKLEPVVAIAGGNSQCMILSADGRVHACSPNGRGCVSDGQCFGNDFRAFEDDFHRTMDRKEAEEARIAREKAEREAREAAYMEQGLCRYCGGTFKKGLFFTKCTACGQKKDY